MFSVSKATPARPNQGSSAWLSSHRLATRRQFALVAVADQAALVVIKRALSELLGARPITPIEARLHQVPQGWVEVRAEFRFEAEESERHALADLIRHLCAEKGVRYLRLDAR